MGNSSAERRLRKLAELVAFRNRNTRTEPYSLFLGAGCSLSSGAPAFGLLFKDARVRNYDQFCQFVCSLNDTERYNLFRKRFENLQPSRAALQLAQLATEGYFSTIFTTNFDDVFERALIAVGATPQDFVVEIVTRNGLPTLGALLSRSTPPIKYIKLHGDFHRRQFAVTRSETAQFHKTCESVLSEYLRVNDLIVVGSQFADLDLLRCFDRDGGSVWFINPTPPRDHARTILEARGAQDCIISGPAASFENLMKEVVRQVGLNRPACVTPPSGRQRFSVRSHKFISYYVGPNVTDISTGESVELYGTRFNVFRFGSLPQATAYLSDFGVGIVHLVEDVSFSSLADLALWRAATYREILREQHFRLNHFVQGVFGSTQKPIYVLSVFCCTEPGWPDPEEFVLAMKLLSAPSLLTNQADQEEDRLSGSLEMEIRVFEEKLEYAELKSFGVDGISTGFASWPGVSYHTSMENHDQALRENEIVEYEIALQALWSLCNTISQLSADELKQCGLLIRPEVLHECFSRLSGASPTERLRHRLMKEALVLTSRLGSVCQQATDKLNLLRIGGSNGHF